MARIVRAKVWSHAVTGLAYSFAVEIIAPIPMPPRLYNIDYRDLLVKVTSATSHTRVLYDILTDRVLHDYNLLIEDSPIMDMFENPERYEKCSQIEWTNVDSLSPIKERRLI